MKKSIAIVAPIAAILMSEGFLFRLLHWPGASFAILIGGILAIVAAILGLVYQLKQPGCKCTKWFVGISLIVAIAAAVFKILHFPGAGILCLIAFGLLVPAAAICLAICFDRKKE